MPAVSSSTFSADSRAAPCRPPLPRYTIRFHGSLPKTPWLKPPLYEYVGNQPGSGITIYLFKSVAGNYTVTVSNIDFEIGEYIFCDEPQPREVSVRKPKSKAWDMQASSSFSMRMNGGGYKI